VKEIGEKKLGELGEIKGEICTFMKQFEGFWLKLGEK